MESGKKENTPHKINPKVNQELCRKIIAEYTNGNKFGLNEKYYSKTSVDDLILLCKYDWKKNTDIIDNLCRPF